MVALLFCTSTKRNHELSFALISHPTTFPFVDIEKEFIDVLNQHEPRIRASLRQEARSAGFVKTGKLTKQFRGKVRLDSFGMPWGLSFSAPRYAYILHHGFSAKQVSDPSNNRSYSHPGIQKSDFISHAIEPHLARLADDLQSATGDVAVDRIRY